MVNIITTRATVAANKLPILDLKVWVIETEDEEQKRAKVLYYMKPMSNCLLIPAESQKISKSIILLLAVFIAVFIESAHTEISIPEKLGNL